MKCLKAILFMSMFTAGAFAQANTAGTSAFPFLSIQYDARSVGMAGADVAMPNGLYGILSNPASLGYDNTIHAMIGYRPVILDIWGSPLAMSFPVKNVGQFAVSLTSLLSGDIQRTEIGFDGDPVTTNRMASCNYVSGGVTWSKLVYNSLSVGATLKGAYNYIATGYEYYSADGFAFDAGAQYRKGRDRLVCGLAVRNIGFMRSGYTTAQKYYFPMTIEAGVSYVPRYMPGVRLALDANAKRGDYVNFQPGIELDVYKKLLQIRGGYGFSSQDLSQGIKALSGEATEEYVKSNWAGLSLGAGINARLERTVVHIDMALQLLSDVSAPSVALSALVDF